MIDFVTNDFLGFARSEALSEDIEARYRDYRSSFPHAQSGSRGSRLVLGPSQLLSDLEERIARFHGSESAFVVHGGYMANVGLCFHMHDRHDMVFWDEGVHISVVNGLRMISGKHHSFPHNRLDVLESLLKNHRKVSSGRIFIFACSVYSLLGTQAPIEGLIHLADMYHAHLIMDEAHALGVFGEGGRGLCHQWGYENFYAVLVTYSKAMGLVGAAILSSADTKQELLSHALPLCYTTMMAPHTLLAIDAAHDYLLAHGEGARNQLMQLQAYFSESMGMRASCCGIPLLFKEFHQELFHLLLEEKDVEVGTFLVRGQTVIRINFHAYNTIEEMHALIQVVQRYLEESGHRVYINGHFDFR